MKRIAKTIISLLLVAVAVLGVSFTASESAVAALDFEKSIADFPESYKVHLRKLHEQYPLWTFTAVHTGIDWAEAVKNECANNRNLVPASTTEYSNLLKSKAAGDYNPSTGNYIQKDSGWVTANELAVSYFMDPRNFLNAANIFQFETLKYVPSSTVEAVENILYGSFMYNKIVTYYNTSGKQITMTKKYSELICEAGERYDINPCYLASKILNEVGAKGSSSVSGTYSGYKGIYNFYNIGATDGAGAIARGLAWARGDKGDIQGYYTTYGRPWTTPKKSILGGAQFLAETYISKGQYTGYFQKFQVNPDCDYALYTHQYMTNVSGADSQGYSTYLSYLGNGTLALERNFSIPVFKNMPGETKQATSAAFADAYSQTGSTSSAVRLRNGPSTTHTEIVYVPSGTALTVNSKTRSDTLHYNNYLQNPYWYNVTCTVGGKSYTGYISADYARLSNRTVVSSSTYTPQVIVKPNSSDDKPILISSDSSVAKVNGSSLSILKNGTFELTAYTLSGGYDKINVTVNKSVPVLTSVSLDEADTESISVKWPAVSGASKYIANIYNKNGAFIKSKTVTKTNVTFTGLESGADYRIYVRSVSTVNSKTMYGPFVSLTASTVLKPPKVTGCTAVEDSDGIALFWNAVACDGYIVYKYDEASDSYKKLLTTDKRVAIVDDKLSNASLYKVRAYNTINSKIYKSSYSNTFKANEEFLTIENLRQRKTYTDSYMLDWDSVKSATGYCVYLKNSDGKYNRISKKSASSLTVDDLKSGTKSKYKVRAYMVIDGVYLYGASKKITAATRTDAVGELSVVSVADGKVKIDWPTVKGRDVYYVYLYDNVQSKYVRVAETTYSQYTFKNLTDTPAKCRVASVIKSDTSSYLSDYSPSVKLTRELADVGELEVQNSKSSIVVSWKEVPMADGYEVRKLNEITGKYEKVTRTTSCTYSFLGLESGEKISVKVRAFRFEDSQRVYSGYSLLENVTVL